MNLASSHWLNYHHLFYFMVIAEEGTVSKASEKLRLGQPTLSAQLKQFEESLGVKLFDRFHKKLVITEQGKVALDYARSIFKLGSEMYEVLQDRLAPKRVALSIGALDSVAKQIVLQIVKAAFRQADCVVTLSEGKSDELLELLAAHRIDLLLTNFLPSGAVQKGLSHRLLTQKYVGVFGAPKFRGLRKGFPRSISGKPMILPTYDSKLRFDFDQWARSQGLELNIVAESQDIAVKKLMAVNELGLIPSAAHTVTRQVLDGELVELGRLSGVHEELFLVSANRRIENPVAAHLMANFSV